ncbi:hypothetical protein CEY12_00595 [Chryseobacterium sp. T16E-39]|uniref:lipase family protein n=1 Tax=Chryseobacterium sp. T16E-39 TaxID=2015076 RepID=UPI000B5B41B3|nr:lipase family protein [Chryseobacterium sp. T16E-39]ASK28697.1 hypothetical protein CEY12_00595 [Chryseobacterium sp. T16E-39]
MEQQEKPTVAAVATESDKVNALKYAGAIQMAVGVGKYAPPDQDYYPDKEAYYKVYNDPSFALVRDVDFLANFNIQYTIQVKENVATMDGKEIVILPEEYLSYYGYIAMEANPTDPKNPICVVAFRGTQTLFESYEDKRFAEESFIEYDNMGKCKIPQGFHEMLKKAQIVPLKNSGNTGRASLFEFARNPGVLFGGNAPKYITAIGYSLGATMATYFAALATLKGRDNVRLFTFASPRVGNFNFITWAAQLIKENNIVRSYNSADEVPTLPDWPSINGNRCLHVPGKEFQVDSTNDYKHVRPGPECAHQLSVYMYLMDSSKNPNVVGAGGHKDCMPVTEK